MPVDSGIAFFCPLGARAHRGALIAHRSGGCSALSVSRFLANGILLPFSPPAGRRETPKATPACDVWVYHFKSHIGAHFEGRDVTPGDRI